MAKEEIINYVMHSPENTNVNILRDMLNQLDGVSIDKEEIISYVMYSPENTNVNILRDMLNQFDDKSSNVVGTGQVGYMTLKS